MKKVISVIASLALLMGLSSCELLNSLSGSGTEITMGKWPQTKVDLSEDQIASLQETGRKYPGNMTENVEYKDSDGNCYVKVMANPVGLKYFSDGTEVIADSNYYFKVEPIIWKKLGKTSHYMTEQGILGPVPYCDSETCEVNKTRTLDGKTVYPNNYKYSTLRNFLNGTFFDYAFTEEEKSKILDTEVSNGALSTSDEKGTQPVADGTYSDSSDDIEVHDYTCEDTTDKVYVLSVQEATSADYGFKPFDFVFSKNNRKKHSRMVQASDYTVANYGRVNPVDKPKIYYCYWWTRSPYYRMPGNAYYVNSNGKFTANDTDGCFTALPVITLSE